MTLDAGGRVSTRGSGPGRVKVPHFFHMADDSLFSFAGVYEADTVMAGWG